VDAQTGQLLWELPEWKIKIATIPSPVDLGGGKIFFSGGYNFGSMMVQLNRMDGKEVPEILFRLEAKVFGADQHTPIYYKGNIYGIIPGGKLTCLSPLGERLWVREEDNFGLGPFMIVDDKMLVLDDDEKKPGGLSLFRVDSQGAERLAGAVIIEGHDSWAPMAFADGKAILRNLTTMVCVELGAGDDGS